MAYLTLYRKYRPKGFEKLIGQDHIVQILTNQIKQDKIGHAYLFTGTRGTGKTSTAKMFAKAINCLDNQNGYACGKCAACKALEDPANLDVIEMDAASNNGVDEIRALKEKVNFAPTSVRYKVYIIDEVHMLSPSAFNALLKTLEEPPVHAVFILATTEVHKVPATILSRCMRFDFKLIPTEQIAELIRDIYIDEGKEFDEEAVTAIAKAGEGSARDALSIADTCLSFKRGKLTYDDVLTVIGSTNFDSILNILKYTFSGETGKLLSETESLLALGKQVGVLIADVNKTLRDLLIVKTCDNPNKILTLPNDKFNALESCAKLTDTNEIVRCLETMTRLENQLRYTSNRKIVLETALVTCAKPQTDYSVDALVSRVKMLEDRLEKGVTMPNVVCEPKVETVIKKQLASCDTSAFMGELFKRLRNSNEHFLRQVMEDAHGEINENTLLLYVQESAMSVLGDRQKETLKLIMDDYEPFDVDIKVLKQNKDKEKFDKGIENVKSTFGDVVYVVKDKGE